METFSIDEDSRHFSFTGYIQHDRFVCDPYAYPVGLGLGLGFGFVIRMLIR